MPTTVARSPYALLPSVLPSFLCSRILCRTSLVFVMQCGFTSLAANLASPLPTPSYSLLSLSAGDCTHLLSSSNLVSISWSEFRISLSREMLTGICEFVGLWTDHFPGE